MSDIEIKNVDGQPFVLRGKRAEEAYEHLCALRRYINEMRIEYEDTMSEMRLIRDDLSGNEEYTEKINKIFETCWNVL